MHLTPLLSLMHLTPPTPPCSPTKKRGRTACIILLIYKHRNSSDGGVGFYIKDSINYRIGSNLNDPDIEILTIKIVKKCKAFFYYYMAYVYINPCYAGKKCIVKLILSFNLI